MALSQIVLAQPKLRPCQFPWIGKWASNNVWQTHPLHLLQQQRNVVDSLGNDVQYLIHAQSLAQSGIYLQIWANRKDTVAPFSKWVFTLPNIKLRPSACVAPRR